ncbi:MAG TPA: hypothetical protein PLH95_10140, partial [Thauera aminoaromatica]|nr:hypothetical protein [Thauera aminoaromatica]
VGEGGDAAIATCVAPTALARVRITEPLEMLRGAPRGTVGKHAGFVGATRVAIARRGCDGRG